MLSTPVIAALNNGVLTGLSSNMFNYLSFFVLNDLTSIKLSW